MSAPTDFKVAQTGGPNAYIEFLTNLAAAGRAVTSSLNVRDVLHEVMKSVSTLLTPRTWALLLWEPSQQCLRIELAVGEYAESLKGRELALGQGVAGYVAQHRQPLVVESVREDERFSSMQENDTVLDKGAFARFQRSSVLAVPLIFDHRLLGVIELIRLEGEAAFTQDEISLLAPFADFAAVAINNAANFERVKELTIVDEWTGLYNARFLRRYIRDEVARARRYSRSLSILFLDLDGFKQVNDLHGHGSGSKFLKGVGHVLRESIRDTDRAVRYGGDEFVVLLPETDHATALKVAQRLRGAIQSYGEQSDYQVTSSVGVATFPEHAPNAQALLETADAAMYQAKADGKNCVRGAKATEDGRRSANNR